MDNNKKLKLRITALTLASTLILNGCGVNNKFKITENENNEIVSLAGSYISKNYINDYYVLELFNNLTNEKELFIARKKGTNINRKYYDVFTNFKIYEEYDELKEDFLFKFIKDSELTYYIVALLGTIRIFL